MNNIQEAYDLIFTTFTKIVRWNEVVKNMKKNPFPGDEYGEPNIGRLIQDIVIITDIMTSDDPECLIMRSNPDLLHQRDLKFDTEGKKLKQQYIDFIVGAWQIEYKCPFFANDSKLQRIKENWQMQNNSEKINTRKLRVINIDLNLIEAICQRVPELWTVQKSLKFLLVGLTLEKRMHLKNKDYSNEFTQDDVTHSVVIEILKDKYDFKHEDIQADVDKIEEELKFKDFDFSKESNGDAKWDKTREEMLSEVKHTLKFFQNVALNTEDIVDHINVDENYNTKSFSRDDMPTGRRLKNVMNTLPDRRYIPLDEMGSKARLSDLFKYMDERYFDGMQFPIDTIIENFEDFQRLEVLSELFYEKKSEEKTVIAKSEEQKVRLVDIVDKKREKLEALGIYTVNEEELQPEIERLRTKFHTKKTLHCSIETFVKKQKADTERKKKPVAQIKDYENMMTRFIETHKKGVIDDLEHPLLQDTILEEIYSNKDIDDLMKNLIKAAIKDVRKMKNTNTYSILTQQDSIYTDIMIQMYKSFKDAKSTDFKVIYHPHYGYYSISFRAAGVSTGPIVFFGAYEGKSRFNEMYPESIYNYDEESNIQYFITKPLSMSMECLKMQKELKYKWLMKVLEGKDYGINFEKSTLFNSLFFQQNSNVEEAIMYFYLLYKNYNQVGSFGKFESDKKLKLEGVCDARLATVVFRFKKNWRKFINKIKENELKGSDALLSIKDVKDPIFNFKHKSVITAFLIQFFKAVLPKNSGVDERHFLAKETVSELEHKMHYYFCHTKINLENGIAKIPLSEFYKTLYNEDYTDWDKISWHPETVILAMHKVIDISEQKNTEFGLRKKVNEYKRQELMKETKTTSINCISNEKLREEMYKYVRRKQKEYEEKSEVFDTNDLSSDEFVKEQHKAGRFLGIYSMPLTLNQIERTLELETDLREFALKKSMVWTGFTRLPDEFIMAHYMLKCPIKDLITTMHVKYQKGPYRGFFMLSDNWKYTYAIADRISKAILENMPGDSIAKPGTHKLYDFEESFRSQGMNRKARKSFNITCDETRYGDEYPVEVIMYKMRVKLERGLLTKFEYNHIMYALNKLRNRKIMMHPHTVKHCEDVLKMSSEKQTVYLNNREIMTVMIQVYLMDYRMEGQENMESVFACNKWVNKCVGWVLGNLNFDSSTDTYAHALLAVESTGFLIPEYLEWFFKTHSDDEKICTDLECPTVEEVKNSKLLKDLDMILREGKKFRIVDGIVYELRKITKKSYIRGELISQNDTKKIVSIYTTKDFAALLLLLSVATPRTVGQRPSCFKWTWGTSSEMLQTVQCGAVVLEPTTKWSYPLIETPNNKGYGRDLTELMARSFPAWMNGADEVSVTRMMVLCNLYVSERYNIRKSVSKNFLRFDVPPEMGGIVVFPASFYSRTGLATNWARLVTLSERSRKTCALWATGSDMWYREEGEVQENFYSLRNFDITSSAFTKMMRSYSTILEKSKIAGIIPEDIDTTDASSFKKEVKELIDKRKLELLIKKYALETVILNKLSDQTKKSKQEEGLDKYGYWTMKAFGYASRYFKNPFEDSQPLKYFEIVDLANIIIDNTINYDDRTLKIFEKINSEEIAFLKTLELKLNFTAITDYTSFTMASYQIVKQSRNMTTRNMAYMILCMVAELYSFIKEPLQMKRTMTYNYYKNKIEDGFITLYNQWFEVFKEIKLKKEDVLSKFQQILNFMTNIEKPLILKQFNEKISPIEDRLRYNCGINLKCEIYRYKFTLDMFQRSVQFSANKSLEPDPRTQQFVAHLALTVAQVKGMDLKDIMYSLEGQNIEIEKLATYKNKIPLDKINKDNKDIMTKYILQVLLDYNFKSEQGIIIERDMPDFAVIFRKDPQLIYRILNERTINANELIDLKSDIEDSKRQREFEEPTFSYRTKFRSFKIRLNSERTEEIYFKNRLFWAKMKRAEAHKRGKELDYSNKRFISAEFIIFNYWGKSPMLYIKIDKNSYLPWTHAIIDIFYYFMVNKEKRAMKVLEPVRQENFNLKKYDDGTYEIFPIGIKTDMKMFDVEFVNKIKVRRNTIYQKDKIILPKVGHWGVYTISAWVSHKITRDITLKNRITNEVIYNDYNKIEGKIPIFEDVISQLHLGKRIKAWFLNLSNQTIEGLQYMSIINNYLIDLKGLNRLLNGGFKLVRKVAEREIRMFLDNITLAAKEIKSADTDIVKAKKQLDLWANISLFKFVDINDLDRLTPRVWLKHSTPKYYCYTQKQVEDWSEIFKSELLDPSYIAEVISLQSARGNIRTEVLIKLVKGLNLSRTINKEGERNLVYQMLNKQRWFTTDLRIDYLFLWLSREYFKSRELVELLDFSTLIKNDILQESKSKYNVNSY
jgi:hypothetical protein